MRPHLFVITNVLLGALAQTAAGAGAQQIAMASYIDPSDTADWTRLINYPTSKLSVLIANVNNGPDSVTNSNWQNVIQQANASGKKVLGYVRTGYLGLSQQAFTTRLNSKLLADWTAQIEEDVDAWYNLYPNMISGIFLDEGWNQCGTDNEYSALYEYISQSTKRKYPGAFTVLNPGTGVPQCFENSTDTLLTSETDYQTYLNAFVSDNWTPSDDRKIWHIVYNVPDGQQSAVAALALQRGAGLLEITNGVLPNPYNTLPSDEYMQAIFNAVTGDTPLVDGLNGPPGGPAAANPPGQLSVVTFDYSSVTLSWNPAPNAVGYRIYTSNSNAASQPIQILDLPSSMTRVQIGGLVPGTSGYVFQVSTVGGDGNESPTRSTTSSNTLALPAAGNYVSNVKASPSSGTTSFQADVLVPYGLVSVFVFTQVDNTQCAGWSISFTSGDFVCAQYMVQSGILYQYNGAPGAFTWSWSQIGTVTSQQVNYTITWNVPIGLSTVNTTNFVIQASGYDPLTNVFSPCGALGKPVTVTNSHCEN